jgi:hypothetical protein
VIRAARRPAALPLLLSCPLAGLALFSPGTASAFTIDSTVTSGCHEDVTTDALRTLRVRLPDFGRVAAVGDEDTLPESLPFAMAADMTDTGSLAILIANRDVDLEGGRATDVTRLAQVHSNPATQDHHCLRAFGDDEPGGAAHALAACRARIRAKSLEAASHANAAGGLDGTKRVPHRTDIAYRGPREVSLPPALVALGEALHTVQDGFAHTYRTSDGLRIVTILNFVDPQEGRDTPERDGPAHLAALDRCDNPDELRAIKRQRATEATAALAEIVLSPAHKDDREAAIDAFLDTYFTLEPGCTAQNGWCGAPEAALVDESACGCAVPGKGSSMPAGTALFGGLAALAVFFRRQTRRLAPSLAAGALLFASSPARADDKPEPPPAPPPERDVKVPTSTEGENTKGKLGVAVGGSFSVDNPAVAARAGLRYNVGHGFLVGPDIEWNPWLSLEREESKAGVLNMYLTGVRRWHVGSRWIHLRTTAKLGASRMLFNLYGAPAGTTGPFVGFSLLGLELNIWRGLAVVIEPSEIAIPIPQTTGTPFVYTQYRFSLGVQWGAVPLAAPGSMVDRGSVERAEALRFSRWRASLRPGQVVLEPRCARARRDAAVGRGTRRGARSTHARGRADRRARGHRRALRRAGQSRGDRPVARGDRPPRERVSRRGPPVSSHGRQRQDDRPVSADGTVGVGRRTSQRHLRERRSPNQVGLAGARHLPRRLRGGHTCAVAGVCQRYVSQADARGAGHRGHVFRVVAGASDHARGQDGETSSEELNRPSAGSTCKAANASGSIVSTGFASRSSASNNEGCAGSAEKSAKSCGVSPRATRAAKVSWSTRT